MSCAGIYVAWHPDACCTLGQILLMGVALQPVFQWAPFCGQSHGFSSRRGMRETFALGHDGPSVGSSPRHGGRDDVQHHYCDGVPLRSLHEGSPLATPYFHPRAKKRAAWPGEIAGSQSAFQWSMFPTMFWVTCSFESFPTDELPFRVIGGNVGKIVWVTNDFNMTLGFFGEGPTWSVISANVDSFATNFNCLQWDADAFMLQEARVADSNLVESQRTVSYTHLTLPTKLEV